MIIISRKLSSSFLPLYNEINQSVFLIYTSFQTIAIPMICIEHIPTGNYSNYTRTLNHSLIITIIRMIGDV